MQYQNKTLFPFTKALPYVELLPQRKYNSKSPDSSFNYVTFGTWSTYLCFSFLACDSRKTSALLGLAVVSLRELIVLKLNRLEGLYFCEVVTAPSALIKCFIWTSHGIYTFYFVFFFLVFTCFISSWGQGRSLILSVHLRHHVGFYFLCWILPLQIFVEWINIVF